MTRLRSLSAALVAAAALPLPAAAGQAQASFAYGRAGGNIAPYRVTIDRSGAVSASGAIRRSSLVPRIPATTASRLLARARRAGFFAMPRRTQCPRTLPDVAGFSVTVSTPSRTRTVAVRGGCRPAYNRLLAALETAVRR
jgi:hypothetical protein